MATANNTKPSPNTVLIERKLEDIGKVLLAMNQLARSYENGVDGGTLSTAVESMSKQAFKSIDACIARLGGIKMGYFSDEFESVVTHD